MVGKYTIVTDESVCLLLSREILESFHVVCVYTYVCMFVSMYVYNMYYTSLTLDLLVGRVLILMVNSIH